MDDIHGYYSRLFSRDPLVEPERELQRYALKPVETKVAEVGNRKLLERPSHNEIDLIVENMSKEKSLGIDGLTAKIL